MKGRDALIYVLIAFVVSVLSVTFLGAVDGDKTAIIRVGMAMSAMAGVFGTLVGQYQARKNAEDRKPCYLCRGEFPDEEAFKGHSCAVAAVSQSPVIPDPADTLTPEVKP